MIALVIVLLQWPQSYVKIILSQAMVTFFQVKDYLCGSARLQRSTALFLLSAKKRFHLTQSALNFVTQQVQQMVSFAVDDNEEAVKKHLNDCGVPTQNAQLDAQFEVMRDPFSSLQTEYLQTFYREKFNLVVSCHVLCN